MKNTSTPGSSPAAYHLQRHRITLALSEFTLSVMRNVYQRFDGDLIAAIVLGEIGARNVGTWLAAAENDPKVLDDPRRRGEVLRPCNALSVAEATGIPRETVRRKLAMLIERGMVERDAGGQLFVGKGLADDFDALTYSNVESLREVARRIEALLAQKNPE